MWRKLQRFLWPKPEPILILRRHDFTKPTLKHWAGFDYGDNNAAYFTLRTNGIVEVGDEILVNMRSGRVCRYRLYSVRPDFTGVGDWKAQAAIVGYWGEVAAQPKDAKPLPQLPAPKVTALLSDGSWRSRSGDGQLFDLSDGTVVPTSEFWKIHTRHETCSRRSDSMR